MYWFGTYLGAPLFESVFLLLVLQQILPERGTRQRKGCTGESVKCFAGSEVLEESLPKVGSDVWLNRDL